MVRAARQWLQVAVAYVTTLGFVAAGTSRVHAQEPARCLKEVTAIEIPSAVRVRGVAADSTSMRLVTWGPAGVAVLFAEGERGRSRYDLGYHQVPLAEPGSVIAASLGAGEGIWILRQGPLSLEEVALDGTRLRQEPIPLRLVESGWRVEAAVPVTEGWAIVATTSEFGVHEVWWLERSDDRIEARSVFRADSLVHPMLAQIDGDYVYVLERQHPFRAWRLDSSGAVARSDDGGLDVVGQPARGAWIEREVRSSFWTVGPLLRAGEFVVQTAMDLRSDRRVSMFATKDGRIESWVHRDGPTALLGYIGNGLVLGSRVRPSRAVVLYEFSDGGDSNADCSIGPAAAVGS